MKPLLQRVSPVPELEKKAYAIHLGKDDKEWPTTILQEAFKQVPYIRNYEVDVDMDRIDDGRGFGVGKMTVYPAKMTKEAALKQDRMATFPLVVKDYELSPLDVVSYKDDMYPASEEFLAEKLFRPSISSGVAQKNQFSPQGMAMQIDPPAQRLRQSVGITKTSSVGNIWSELKHSMKKEDVESIKDDLRNDPSLRIAAVANPDLTSLLEDIFTTSEKTAEDIRKYRLENLVPTTVHFTKRDGGYFVKVANRSCYNPITTKASRYDVQAALGSGFQELLDDGYYTLTQDTIKVANIIKTEASIVKTAGVYTVYDGMKAISGGVIPHMITLEGRKLDAQLYLGASQHAMQEKIAGVRTGPVQFSPNEEYGTGVFVYSDGTNSLATEPVRILSRVEIPDGEEKLAYVYAEKLSNGEHVAIQKVKGLEKIARVNNEVFLPSGMFFVQIPTQSIKLLSDTSSIEKIANKKGAHSITVVSDGDFYQLRNSPFDKIMKREEASFALSNHGLSRSYTEHVLDKSASAEYVIPHTHPIVGEAALQSETLQKIASSRVNIDKLKVDLIKEASVIVDKETVDSILSLRFITPENASLFVKFIPDFEKTASRLAEILVASRLGMEDIKEVAAKNAMGQLSSVIDGLKRLESKVL